MDKFLDKLVDNTLPHLPPELQLFILKSGWEDKTEEIGQHYGLDQQETYKLKTGLLLVIFCIQPLADFKANVQKVVMAASLGEIINAVKQEVLGEEIQEIITKYNEEQILREQRVNERYAGLPASLRQALLSVEMEKIIITIAHLHELHVDQTGILNDEAIKVITGQTLATNFASQLQKSLALELDEATLIAKEVSKMIFEPLRAAMKQAAAATSDQAEEPIAPLDREQVLKEIENPAPLNTASRASTAPSNLPTGGQEDIFEQKLSGSFNLPRVETATREDGTLSQTQKPRLFEKEVDPYRETLK